MIMFTDDPVHDFNMQEEENYKWIQSRPKCCWCGEPIQEEYALRLDGEWMCDKCVKENRRYIEVTSDMYHG